MPTISGWNLEKFGRIVLSLPLGGSGANKPGLRYVSLPMKEDTIKILGARVHNLKNVDLEIPRRKLVVVTGLSGSGKSSLAFDTIYAEGQRRYMETLSTYARQFVGTMERPDVDKITGLSPVVAIEQKTTNKNPRSTVGTVTEINDFLRLLYARASRAYSPVTGEEMVHYSDDQIAGLISKDFAGRKIALLAPVVKGRKGHYRELFETLAKKGYLYARIDGEIREISAGMRLDRYKIHTIDLVVDRMTVSDDARDRIMTSLKEALRQGKGTMALYDYGTDEQRFYSRHLMCPSTGVAFEDPAPHYTVEQTSDAFSDPFIIRDNTVPEDSADRYYDVGGVYQTFETEEEAQKYADALNHAEREGKQGLKPAPSGTDGKQDNSDLIGKELMIDNRRYVIESVGKISGDVSMRDVTFQNNVGFPINRVEKVGYVRRLLEQAEKEPAHP